MASLMPSWLFADQIKPAAIFYPLAWTAILFGLSSIPGDVHVESSIYGVLQWVSPPIQNVLHIPVYALLAILWCRALRAWHIKFKSLVLTAFLLTVAYGALDEWWQAFVPGRYSSMGDLLLDVMGAAGGVAVYFHFARKRIP